MTSESLPAEQSPSDLQAEAAFKKWVGRLVKGAAELKALVDGDNRAPSGLIHHSWGREPAILA